MEHVDTNSKEYNDKMFRHFASLIQPMRVIEAKLAKCTAIEKEMNKPRNMIMIILKWLAVAIVAFCVAAGIVIPILKSMLVGMVPVDAMSNEAAIPTYLENNAEMFLKVIGMGLVGAIVIFILEIIVVIVVFKKLKSAQKAKLEEKYRIAKEDFNKEFDKYEEGLKLVPKGYWNSYALDFFVKEYQSGKVDTVKEALQAYDLYCHRNRLEQQQQQILQNQAMLSEQIKQNSEDILWSMLMK